MPDKITVELTGDEARAVIAACHAYSPGSDTVDEDSHMRSQRNAAAKAVVRALYEHQKPREEEADPVPFADGGLVYPRPHPILGLIDAVTKELNGVNIGTPAKVDRLAAQLNTLRRTAEHLVHNSYENYDRSEKLKNTNQSFLKALKDVEANLACVGFSLYGDVKSFSNGRNVWFNQEDYSELVKDVQEARDAVQAVIRLQASDGSQ